MHGKPERFVIGESPLYLKLDQDAARLTIPAGHIDAARKVVDVLGHTLRNRNIAFTLKQGENTVEFIFAEIGSGRLQGKQLLDGTIFRSALTELQGTLPDSAALEKLHKTIRETWVAKTESASAPANRIIG